MESHWHIQVIFEVLESVSVDGILYLYTIAVTYNVVELKIWFDNYTR